MDGFLLYWALDSSYVIFIGCFKVNFYDNNYCIQFVNSMNFMMNMQKMDQR